MEFFESYNDLKVFKGVALKKQREESDRVYTIIIQVELAEENNKLVDCYITTAQYLNNDLDSYERDTFYKDDLESSNYDTELSKSLSYWLESGYIITEYYTGE